MDGQDLPPVNDPEGRSPADRALVPQVDGGDGGDIGTGLRFVLDIDDGDCDLLQVGGVFERVRGGDFLEENFVKFVDYAFTAQMEENLDQIAAGELDRSEWLKKFYFGTDDEDCLHDTVQNVG